MAQRNGLLQRFLNDPERLVTNQRFVIRLPPPQPNLAPPNPNPSNPGPSNPGRSNPGPSNFDRPATPPPPNRPRNPKPEFARLMMSGKNVILPNDRYYPKWPLFYDVIVIIKSGRYFPKLPLFAKMTVIFQNDRYLQK